MSRAKRLAPVQDVVDHHERRCAQALAECEHRVTQALAKLEELEGYRAEYAREFAQAAARGIGATSLRDYQAFLARLAQAVTQQSQVIERLRVERNNLYSRWQEAARRAKALGHVVSKWAAEDRRNMEAREQRETDERAQLTAQRALRQEH
ncbi:MAG: flagellar export protein FliJ [Proteobacteria bacterium]|nr:MAG: flagellar export protein FliJ [Pseudomonadota bacterium]